MGIVQRYVTTVVLISLTFSKQANSITGLYFHKIKLYQNCFPGHCPGLLLTEALCYTDWNANLHQGQNIIQF